MSIVVGFGSDTRSVAALDLAAEIAQTTGDPIAVVSVVQDSWDTLHDFAGVDDEWRRQVRDQAAEALADVRDRLADHEVSARIRTGRSVPQTLLEETRILGARMVVTGSATHGPLGRIAFGSTNDRLAHSSEAPVAIAPRGYAGHPDGIERLVVAVDPSASDEALAQPVADLAGWLGVPVEIVTFAVRSDSRSAFSTFANLEVRQAWEDLVRDHQLRLAERITELAPETHVSTVQVSSGERWSLALESYGWRGGDLLAVGSSQYGPVARVFVGSTATRIVNHSPVPVVLLPRPAGTQGRRTRKR